MTPLAATTIFNQKIKNLVKQAHSLEEEAVKRSIRLLEESRKEIISQVATSDWQSYRLKELKGAVERSIADFESKYKDVLKNAQYKFNDFGINYVDIPLNGIGINAQVLLIKANMVTMIDPTVVAIMQDYSADLVTGLARDAVLQINRELAAGILGQKTPYDIMIAIGGNLNGKSVFSSIAKRAEVITRTEGSRVLQAASHARGMEAAKVLPGLGKQWKHDTYGKNPRPGHLAADGQTRKEEEPFDISPNAGGVTEKLQYPKDPAGSAKNTINCSCYKIPYHPDWDELIRISKEKLG